MLFLVEAFVGAFQDPCAVEDGDEGFVGAFFGLDVAIGDAEVFHVAFAFLIFFVCDSPVDFGEFAGSSVWNVLAHEAEEDVAGGEGFCYVFHDALGVFYLAGEDEVADEEKPDLNDQLAAQTETEGAVCKIIAVTSCPTGIAHTYMAAEGLEKAAKAHNCSIKVETRGSGGAKNVLTDEEIANADCVIVAADAQVPMDRFNGKKLIEVPVSDGISKADQLVERAINGDAPIYHSSNVGSQSASSQKASGGIGHRLYVHLMNGVSHMLPFVVGGGILIAIAFLIDGMNVDINSLSADMRANFGTITPVAAAFKQIGGIAFGLMLPVLAGFIAMSIGDRPALAVGFVGGMMAANGKSGFLGALAAGFLAGLIILLLKKVFAKLPDALEKITPVLLYPVCGILLMGIIMMFVIEPPVGALNTALNTALTNMGASSKILLGIVCAGMMAIDMGGPFNKAAYVFGTAVLTGEPIIRPCIELYGFVPVHKVGDMSVVKNNLRVVPFAGRMYFYRVEVR